MERLNLSGRRVCRDLSARDGGTQRSTLSRGQSGGGRDGGGGGGGGGGGEATQRKIITEKIAS